MLKAHHTFDTPCLWNVDSDRELIELDHQPNIRHAVLFDVDRNDADQNDPKHLLLGWFPSSREWKSRLVRDFLSHGGVPTSRSGFDLVARITLLILNTENHPSGTISGSGQDRVDFLILASGASSSVLRHPES